MIEIYFYFKIKLKICFFFFCKFWVATLNAALYYLRVLNLVHTVKAILYFISINLISQAPDTLEWEKEEREKEDLDQ